MPLVTEPRIQQSVSLLPRHLRGLRWLTNEAGDTNLSATIRRLIETAMRDRFGLDWEEVIDRAESEAA